MTDERLHYPATARNRDTILDVMHSVLPPKGLVLEIASGSGEHAVHFAGAFPNLAFQPSDPQPEAVRSIKAWIADSGITNVRPPLTLDVTAPDWPHGLDAADAMLCINMIHIAPWAAAEGLIRGAARILRRGAPLYLYGPYRRAEIITATSNEAFDADLKARNPQWGLRDLADVAALARAMGFSEPQITEMPANNLSVVFRKI